LLCRDLLQKLLGVRFESFTIGRDSGIDFRYRRDSENLVVQCKHCAESGYDVLARVLALEERKKLDALKPTRYILATSVGFTPSRKQELLGTLAPYCVEPADLLGRDDINNNLLTQHADVERQHLKLWLTSATVLERVLNEGIFSESDRHLEPSWAPPEKRRGRQNLTTSSYKYSWLRGRDLNPRPLGYEPNELPDCSTPRH
jgi:hypothetical protein